MLAATWKLFTVFHACLLPLFILSACSLNAGLADPGDGNRQPAFTGKMITVTNSLSQPRRAATVALDWKRLRDGDFTVEPAKIEIVDANGRVLLTQNVDLDADGIPDQLLFQSSIDAGETKQFILRKGSKSLSVETPIATAFARHVPERFDDFAWENDRVAFRMYGPALQKHGEVSSGIDIWAKRTNRNVINKWYAGEDYHVDHGEGLDFYKVGPSRGGGGLAIMHEGKFYPSANFARWRIVANGPIRTIFELEYGPWKAGNIRYREVKRISLDLGSHFNRIESWLTSDSGGKANIAVGLVMRSDNQEITDKITRSPSGKWFGLWTGPYKSKDQEHGFLGTAIILPNSGWQKIFERDGHLWGRVEALSGKPVAYYTGFGWQKAGQFSSADQWFQHVDEASRLVGSPLQIK